MAHHAAKYPENAKDLHRKLTAADALSEFLAWREERTVTKNLTLQRCSLLGRSVRRPRHARAAVGAR
jgi:hypothetical protein